MFIVYFYISLLFPSPPPPPPLSLSLSLFLFSLSLPLLLSSYPLSSRSLSYLLLFPISFLLFLPTQHAQWKSDALESIKKYMDVRLQVEELRDEKDNEIRELRYRLDHRPRPVTRHPSGTCSCNGWKIACFILCVMVILLVIVLAAVITLQVVNPEMRPI